MTGWCWLWCDTGIKIYHRPCAGCKFQILPGGLQSGLREGSALSSSRSDSAEAHSSIYTDHKFPDPNFHPLANPRISTSFSSLAKPINRGGSVMRPCASNRIPAHPDRQSLHQPLFFWRIGIIVNAGIVLFPDVPREDQRQVSRPRTMTTRSLDSRERAVSKRGGEVGAPASVEG